MNKNWKTSQRRGQVLEHARQLARSGQHANHTTIIPDLAQMEGFVAARPPLEDRAIRSQFDKLCAMARARRERPVEVPPLTSTRA